MKKNILLVILFFVSIAFIFIDNISNKVLAVTQGDYNRTAPGGGILLDHWNFLDEDPMLSERLRGWPFQFQPNKETRQLQ